jgi:DNA repair protein RadC
MFHGTIDGASVHPREVVKEALKQNAAAVILAHPHTRAAWRNHRRPTSK